MMQTTIEFPSLRFRVDPDDLADERERAVLAALKYGRENARRIPELAAATGLRGREVQSVIERLVFDRGVAVGTSMGKPPGAYLIDSPEDLDATAALLMSRAIHGLRRVAALKKITHRRLLAEIQTELLDDHRRVA